MEQNDIGGHRGLYQGGWTTTEKEIQKTFNKIIKYFLGQIRPAKSRRLPYKKNPFRTKSGTVDPEVLRAQLILSIFAYVDDHVSAECLRRRKIF